MGSVCLNNLYSHYVQCRILYYLMAKIYYCVFDITAYFCLFELSVSENGRLKLPALIVNFS